MHPQFNIWEQQNRGVAFSLITQNPHGESQNPAVKTFFIYLCVKRKLVFASQLNIHILLSLKIVDLPLVKSRSSHFESKAPSSYKNNLVLWSVQGMDQNLTCSLVTCLEFRPKKLNIHGSNV